MKPRIVLIGAGKFGKKHLRSLIQLQHANMNKVIGVVDKNPNILSEIEKDYKLQTSTNTSYFLEDMDAVDIITPPSTHYSLVKFFLKKNKHVFVEKPLALSSRQANELVIIARKNKKILQVGHIFRYDPTVELLRKLVQRKDNFPFYIMGRFLQDTQPKHDLGAIFIFMHGFDILDNLFSLNPKKIFARSNLDLLNPHREINAVVDLQLQKGVNATINVGWIPTGKQRKIELYSKKKYITCDLLCQRIQVFQNGLLEQTLVAKSTVEPLLEELKEFSRCIKNNTRPKSDGAVGAKIVRICEIANNSIKKNKVLHF